MSSGASKVLPDGMSLRRYTGEEARQIEATVEGLHRRSYVDAIASGDPFESTAEFMRRFETYSAISQFDMVIASIADEPVGQAWGWPLSPNSGWWDGLELDTHYDDDSFTIENGTRTFAFSELMVCVEFTGRGVARGLHDQLLAQRPEQRATLFVNPANDRAYSTYRRWGWQRVGTLKPHWPDAPQFDVLVHELSAT